MRLVRVRTRALFSRGALSTAGFEDAGLEVLAGREVLGASTTFFAATIRPVEPAGI